MKTILIISLALIFSACASFTIGKDVTKVSDKAIIVKGTKEVFVIDTNGDTFLNDKYCGTNTELQQFFAKLASQQTQAVVEPKKATPKKTPPKKKTK